MQSCRASIAVNRAYTPAGANEFFVGIGLTGTIGATDIPVEYIYLRKLEIYQNNTNPKSLQLYHTKQGGRTAIGSLGQYNFYNNDLPAGATMFPNVFTHDTQLLNFQLVSPFRIQLGPNVGDYAHLTFPEPGIICRLTNEGDSIHHSLSLRVAESNPLDLNITWVFDVVIPSL